MLRTKASKNRPTATRSLSDVGENIHSSTPSTCAVGGESSRTDDITMRPRTLKIQILISSLLLILLLPTCTLAYIGPGAGFGLAVSFLPDFAPFFSPVSFCLCCPFAGLFAHWFRQDHLASRASNES